LTTPDKIFVYDKNKSATDNLLNSFNINVLADVKDISNADIIILAVKPDVIYSVIDNIKGYITKDKIIISIAAGQSIKKLSNALGDNTYNLLNRGYLDTVTVNDKTYNTSINNGKASVNVTGLTKSVNASVNYTGDDNYNSALINVIIIVNSDDVITDILSIVMGYDIIKYLKMQQKYSVNTNSITLDVKYLQNLL
jgi:hypothetical protein